MAVLVWVVRLAALAVMGVALLLPGGIAAAGSTAWVWPLGEPAEVVRPFDPPTHRYAAGHRGADLSGTPGAPVLAAGAGEVSYAGLLAGRGVVVVVHGELRTTYEPVTAGVSVGQQVAAGEVLGQLETGHLGCPVAACLHWGLRRGETYLDPVQLVDPGPARLLPVEGGTAGAPAQAGAPGVVGGPVGPGAPAGPPSSSAEADLPAGAAGPSAQAPGPPAPPPSPPEPVPEPAWSLRAAEAPLGAAAVVALAAGLALVRAPRRPPDGPAHPGAAGVEPPELADAVPAALAAPVDLGAERVRRRAVS